MTVRVSYLDSQMTPVHTHRQARRRPDPYVLNNVGRELSYADLSCVNHRREPPELKVEPHQSTQAGKPLRLCQERKLPLLALDAEATPTHAHHPSHA